MCVSSENANNFLGTFCEVEDVRLKVKWYDCYAQKKIGGLSFTNLNEALLGFLRKWNLYVFELGDLSFKILKWYRLNRCMFLRHKC